MAQKIMTKFVINVIEYDATGYYYPTYKTTQRVIAESFDIAKTEAIKRTQGRGRGSGWTMRTVLVSTEDIVIDI